MAAKSMENIAETIGIAFDRYSGEATTLTVCSAGPFIKGILC